MGHANGCTEYVRGTVEITVSFLPGHVSCRECAFLAHAGHGKFICKANRIGIKDLDGISKYCPLEWEEKHAEHADI